MAAGINKVILIGRLGQDPEVRYTSNGGAVANFSLATSESWTDKQGAKQERTEWHRIVVWGKLGELCGQYLSKGRQAFIEGKLQTRDWTDKEGGKRYTTEVVAQNVQFLGSPGERTGDRAGAGAPAGDYGQPGPSEFALPTEGQGASAAGAGTMDDEVPF